MKKIFISHPYRNDPKHNREAITGIFLRLKDLGILPFSPIHAFTPLNEHVPEEREIALQFCENMIPLCDELWLFGDWQKSDGCQREVAVALEHAPEIPIRIITGWEDGSLIFFGESPEWLKDKRGYRQ